MKSNVLIAGGAGFIGSHLCDYLLERGYRVRVLDNLEPQVHGGSQKPPSYLNPEVEFILGDIRDSRKVETALRGVDMVVHLAAAVGVGQSMYEIHKYMDTNTRGTSVLLEALMKHPVRKLVVASSMSIYGEGLYKSHTGHFVQGLERTKEQLQRADWNVYDESGDVLYPVATSEKKLPTLSSIYALSKYDQERMCLLFGNAYSVPVVAMRFFNVYGPRQALSNPYTGVLAIFASRLLNGKPPLIFEDGNQMRDFVNVRDIASACTLALENDSIQNEVFNIGSGRACSVQGIAESLAAVLDKEYIEPVITGKYRVGDIRHCYADIEKAQQKLGYAPAVTLDKGMVELSGWLQTQIAEDNAEMAAEQLAQRGLTV
ncbi:MAG: SDR family NAD(P)-dependent oxidoreductase [Chitinivibrionales bacterium]|nr:SDR family NAD(P)-dependent oxidoreductase [Chitinivibrionales bacterium]